MARSATRSFDRNVPLWCSSASTSVVFPWSTCAMMAMFRRRGFAMSGRAGAGEIFSTGESILPVYRVAGVRDWGPGAGQAAAPGDRAQVAELRIVQHVRGVLPRLHVAREVEVRGRCVKP